MNLRELAAIDHALILSDVDSGFGIPLTITNPAGVVLVIAGYASDVGEIVDPQTNTQVVSGRRATCSFVTDLLHQAGMGEVEGVADSDSKPWTIAFADALGVVRRYKVIEVKPDTDLGSIRCELESYRMGG